MELVVETREEGGGERRPEGGRKPPGSVEADVDGFVEARGSRRDMLGERGCGV